MTESSENVWRWQDLGLQWQVHGVKTEEEASRHGPWGSFVKHWRKFKNMTPHSARQLVMVVVEAVELISDGILFYSQDR